MIENVPNWCTSMFIDEIKNRDSVRSFMIGNYFINFQQKFFFKKGDSATCLQLFIKL